jgi:hypothetical protein
VDDAALADAWSAAAGALPPGRVLCGVAYHGPDRSPGTEWIAFACDDSGQTVGPEGVGADAFAALRDVVRAMTNDASPR